MVCSISCSASFVFVIAMIYYINRTQTNQTIQTYASQLPPELMGHYKEIVSERTQIFYYGYVLGFVFALFIIIYQTQIRKMKMDNWQMVCLAVAVAFTVNYFYYILSPKSKWMLQYIETNDQNIAWLQIYREMQVSYHSGMVLGLIAIALFAVSFRT